MDISQRFKKERKRLNLSQSDVGDILKIDYKVVGRWEKGADIGSGKLETLSQHGFNLNYIMTGETSDVGHSKKEEGNKSNNLMIPQSDVGHFSPREGVTLNIDDYAWIPLYDVKVSAGHGAFNDNANILTWLSFTKYSLNKRNLNAQNLFAVIVHGDSMYETLKPNDCIFVDITKRDPDGGVFVVRVGDAMHVKRLIREKDSIRVISDNTRYPEWTLDKKDDFKILGKYQWLGRYAD